MSIPGIRRLLRVRFTRAHLVREIDEEIDDHVARRTEALMREGLSLDAALVEARRRFGDVDAVRARCIEEDHSMLRRNDLMAFVDHLRGDLRFALRSLKRAPGFAGVALTTLVFGIAAVTTIFSFVYGYAYRPLPYRDADRIVAIKEVQRRIGRFSTALSPDAARAIVTGSRSFELVALFDITSTRTSVAGNPVDWTTLRIDTSFVPMFGVQPQLGRAMTSDELGNNAPVAMISDVLWHTSLGGDAGAVGRTLRLGDEIVTIVGIMPPGFRFPERTDLWRPLRIAESSDNSVQLLGKMRPGVTRADVASEMSLVGRRLVQSDSQQFAGVTLIAVEMLDRQLGGASQLVVLFIGAAVFVLLIACSNVANLFLVRAAERRGEMAVRSSLGAQRGRLITQMLTEVLVMSAVAGVLGTLLSMGLVRILLAVLPTSGFPSWLTFGIDGRILLFTTALVTLVALAVGLTPAREATRFDLVCALKAGGDGGMVNSGVARSARRALVVQLALSVVLFVSASLLVQTYRRLAAVDVGYPAEEIVSLQPYFNPDRYPNDTGQLRFATAVMDGVARVAGVRQAAVRGFVDPASLSNSAEPRARPQRGRSDRDVRLFADGDTTRGRFAGRARAGTRYMAVTDAHFRALDLRIERGRGFASDDRAGSQPVVILSHRFAKELWPNENPLGRTIQFGARGARITIVGVVDDVRDMRSDRDGIHVDPRADAYFTPRQFSVGQAEVLARGSGDVSAIQGAVQNIARQIDPDVVTSVTTLARNAETQRAAVRQLGSLLGAFALSGLILSIIGIYGVVAYGISQRTREIGVRIALGGTNGDVLSLVLRGALTFVAVGLGAGLVLSFGTTRLMQRLLFDVSPTDPITYAIACTLFGGIAMLACYLPARRVTRIDPLVALRAE